MYAIIEDGSRQYRVEVGSRVRLDYREVKLGDRVEVGSVLLIGDGAATQIGTPAIAGARVVGTAIGMPRVKTVTQKFRRRKASKRLKGHTQPHVEIRVEHILLAGQDIPAPAAKSEPAPAPAPAPEPVAETPAEPTPA